MARSVGVVLLGCGNVGQAVLSRFAAAKELHRQRFGIEFALRAVCDSSGGLFGQDVGQQALTAKQSKTRLCDVAGGVSSSEVDEALAAFGANSIFIDCTATDSISSLLQKVLREGGGVVFANKKVLTGPKHEFDAFTAADAEQRCRFESSVGAGSPFVASVRRIVAAGDRVTRLQGTFSGTLGFITSGLDDGKAFSSLVREAYEKGYTEPDPREDLSGFDVARKALILGRLSGWSAEMSDIDIQPLFPDDLASVSVDEFLEQISKHDDVIRAQQQKAEKENKVLRYVAQAEQGNFKVGLQAVDVSSPIGQLRGTDNILNAYSEIYVSAPLVVQGSGAGADITAAGVIADCVDIAQSLR